MEPFLFRGSKTILSAWGPPIALKFGTHTANGTKLILHVKKAGTVYQGEATRRFKATSHMSRIEVFIHFTRGLQIFHAQRTVALAKTNIPLFQGFRDRAHDKYKKFFVLQNYAGVSHVRGYQTYMLAT